MSDAISRKALLEWTHNHLDGKAKIILRSTGTDRAYAEGVRDAFITMQDKLESLSVEPTDSEIERLMTYHAGWKDAKSHIEIESIPSPAEGRRTEALNRIANYERDQYESPLTAYDNCKQIAREGLAAASGVSTAKGRYREALEQILALKLPELSDDETNVQPEIDYFNTAIEHYYTTQDIIESVLSPSGEQRETPREALEQAIRDFPGDMTSGTSAQALIAWLESTTSFVYDKEDKKQ